MSVTSSRDEPIVAEIVGRSRDLVRTTRMQIAESGDRIRRTEQLLLNMQTQARWERFALVIDQEPETVLAERGVELREEAEIAKEVRLTQRDGW